MIYQSPAAVSPSALSPRTTISTLSQRPTDDAFAFYVRFYSSIGGVQLYWTDSRAEAERFAAKNRCYARPAKVQERSEWAVGRRIWAVRLILGGHVTTRSNFKTNQREHCEITQRRYPRTDPRLCR